MQAASKRPDDNELKARAQEPGMTFVKLANIYAVDRKTVRRWCRDIGINKCGVPENGNTKNQKKPVQGESETAKNRDNFIAREELIGLKNQISLLVDKINLLEQGMSGLSMPLETELEAVGQIDMETFRNVLTEISIACSTGDDMEGDQALIMEHLGAIIWHVLGSEIRRIHNRIENHHHLNLSINNSQEWLEENKRRQQFERGARNAPDSNKVF